MDAGKLRHRITIQKLEKTRSPSGQMVGDWVDVCTVWAQAKCTASKAVTDDGVIQHEGLYKFFIRYRPGITAEMRVLWEGRTFELVGPPADWEAEKSGLTLICKELVNSGQKSV